MNDERIDPRDRLVHGLLEEELGGSAPPDVSGRVLAAGDARRAAAAERARTAGRIAGWDEPRRGRWLRAAAILVLGATVAFAIGLGSSGVGGSGDEGSRDDGGPRPAQDPEPELLRPEDAAAVRAALSRTERISCEAIFHHENSFELQGAVPPSEWKDPSTVDALVEALREHLRPTAPAGWAWPHRFTFHLDDGKVLHLALNLHEQRRIGVIGAGDFLVSEKAAARLRALALEVDWRARRARGVALAAGEIERMPGDLTELHGYGLRDEDLAKLARLENLRLLDLTGSSGTISDLGMAHVARLRTLEKVVLRYTLISDQGLAELAALPHLRELDLTYSAARPPAAGIPTLTWLFEERGAITGKGFEAFAEHGSLAILRLSRARFLDDAGLRAVAALPNLRELELEHPHYTNASTDGLTALADADELRRLDLSDCELSLHPLLQNTQGWTRLEELDLSDTTVDAEALRGLPVPSALRVLDLARCRRIDGEALKVIAGFRSLAELDLARCESVTAADLVELTPLKKLRTLSLAQVPLGDGEHAALAQLVGLRYLDLAFSRVGDAAMETLSKLTGLRELRLAGNHAITDAGLEHLAKMHWLEKLDLFVCDGFTKDGAAILQFYLPDCEIHWPQRLREPR